MESVENEKGNKRKDGGGLWVVWRSERWIKGDKESKETIIEQGRQILSETEQIEKRGESSTFLPSFLPSFLAQLSTLHRGDALNI